MYRKIQDLVHINIVCDDGGIGDNIARIPVVKYILDYHPHVFIHFWVPDYFLEFSNRSLASYKKNLVIRNFTKAKKKFNKNLYARAFSVHHYNNMSIHMTKHAFHVVAQQEPTEQQLNYLKFDTSDQNIKQYDLPEKYVVVATGFTAPIREFLPQYVNEVTKYIVSKGYTPVFLGKTETPNGNDQVIKGTFKEEIDYSVGIDLIDETSLLETREIINNAKTIVGLDNGLLHVAGTTDIPIVGGFTSVNPIHRMPYRHDVLGWNFYPVVPPESVVDRFCQSNWSFTFDHDFKYCFYGDYAIVKALTPDLYIKELEKIL